MKYMFMTNLEMANFCIKNKRFAKIFGYELTTNFPELLDNDDDKTFGEMMSRSVDKNNNIIPALYYKNIDEILSTYGLKSLYCLLLFTNDFHLIGSADIGFMTNGTSVTISNFFTTRRFRRKGYGKTLMTITIKKLKEYPKIKKIILDVDYNNIPANKLYNRMGFIAIDNFGLKKRRMELWL